MFGSKKNNSLTRNVNNNRKINRIHILSASGSGSTTLGANIAKAKKIVHLDADNYLWRASIPPFGKLRSPIERNSLLDKDLRSESSWVLSGSICGWGDFAIRFFDMVIFLSVPYEVRMNRYISRYTKKFGNEILDSQHPLHKRFSSFRTWSSSYDDGQLGLYSNENHEKWLKKLPCPVIPIGGIFTAEEISSIALDKISEV